MESAVIVVPLKKVTATGAVKVIDGREVISTIQDPLFGKFRIYKNATGRPGFWESDPTKVQKLVDAFKAGHNIKNACIYAGITERQWEGFKEAYPEFRGIKEACESVLSFVALETVGKGMKNDSNLAYKYARERGDFNFKKVEEEKPLQPSVNVAVQVNNNTNERTIEEGLRGRRIERLSERSGSGEEDSNEAVAGEL